MDLDRALAILAAPLDYDDADLRAAAARILADTDRTYMQDKLAKLYARIGLKQKV
ncbi:hypothetical protein [Sagittula salina]|uniref:Uncharacterized protein n=1 Tax=Sagittula salina TaxID=2820268 RepID=A0A940MSL1_9RHOB|nr:hypothetical protein [Sagittula salina]MBP0484644.1 hypothetical protein [Sagittula salina]